MGRSHSREHGDEYLYTFEEEIIWEEMGRLDALISKKKINLKQFRAHGTDWFFLRLYGKAMTTVKTLNRSTDRGRTGEKCRKFSVDNWTFLR